MIHHGFGCILSAFLTFGASFGSLLFASDFVTREGHRLLLDGKSFYFSGTNQYYLFYKSQKMIDDVLDRAKDLGLTVFRTWAFCDGEWHDSHSFQPEPGVYNERTFKNLDYAIYKASQNGIRLVLSLVNNWDAFGGMAAYVRWSKSAKSHDDFYSDPETRRLFKNYISYVLNRVNTYTGRAYKDEPAILMWELANEPRAEPKRTEDLYLWIEEMAAHIKSIDKNHLVSTGSEGHYATDLYLTHRSPHIDVVSFHLYPDHWSFDEIRSKNYISKQIKVAKNELKKPIFCGEFGLHDRQKRDRVYKDWYTLFQESKLDGALFWLLSGRQDDQSLYPDYDGFTVYYPEHPSTGQVIKSFSQAMKDLTGRPVDRLPPQVTVETPKTGDSLEGHVVFQGTVTDHEKIKSMTLNFGGVERPATIENSQWTYHWNASERLKSPVTVTFKAQDLAGNETSIQMSFLLKGGSSSFSGWVSSGKKLQDDGHHFIYEATLQNNSKEIHSGHFVARFFISPEGETNVGSHYEASEHYVGNPEVKGFLPYFGAVSFYDIDFGFRTLRPQSYIGYKGQLSQKDGGYQSYNDWTSSEFELSPSGLQRVVWYKDGEITAGVLP